MTLTDMVRSGRAIRDVDLWAGVVAVTWAVLALEPAADLAQLARALQVVVSPPAAAGFGLLALGRWWRRWSLR